MPVVDTCVLIDIADDDPTYGRASAACVAAHLEEGLLISAVSYVELAPVFDGSARRLDDFLEGLGVGHHEPFELADRDASFDAWARHIAAKRAGEARRRPVADALIGAMAARTQGLITRNGPDFLSFYPRLRIIDPMQVTMR